MTKDDYWIIDKPVLIPEGVTVTVTEGTQIQFWSSDPNKPYDLDLFPFIQVEGEFRATGTSSDPVQLFPSGLQENRHVVISTNGLSNYSNQKGQIILDYFQLINAYFGKRPYGWANTDGDNILLSHGHIRQSSVGYGSGNIMEPMIQIHTRHPVAQIHFEDCGASLDSNFTFVDKYSGGMTISGGISGSLLDNCVFGKVQTSDKGVFDSVFLNNFKTVLDPRTGNEIVQPTYTTGLSPKAYKLDGSDGSICEIYTSFELNGKAYLVLRSKFEAIGLLEYEQFANFLNGHVATIDSEEELDGILNAVQEFESSTSVRNLLIGLNDVDGDDLYTWLSGDDPDYMPYLNTPESYEDYIQIYGNFSLIDGAYALTSKGYDGTSMYYSTGTYNPYFVLIELISTPSPSDLFQARLDLARNIGNTFKYNAFLNWLWEPDLDYWGRIAGTSDKDYFHFMQDNYWATNSQSLIDTIFYDKEDDFNLSKIVYDPILEIAPETVFPFVVDCVLSTPTATGVSQVGAEELTFAITFNKDMNTGVQPEVSFGPDNPMTDYTVQPLHGGWQNVRTWTGSFTVTPITGDGLQLIRISGAEAAENSWFVNGNDSGRFRFEIVTSGLEAMNLQATGGEGYIELSWTQDDFDLLAGYNLYRSMSEDGAYERVNDVIIPVGNEGFRDFDVVPGQNYYYYFKVVKSDMGESKESNIGSAAPLDTIPPQVNHLPVATAQPNLPLTILAEITDNIEVTEATLYHRQIGASTYAQRSMVNTTGDRWSYTLEGSRLVNPGVEYYISATDGRSTTLSGRPELPYSVIVGDQPVVTGVSPNLGPASGGTNVTISGANFKPDAKVFFGGTLAVNPIVVNANQIMVSSPVHIPETVSVVIENPDGSNGALNNAYTYFYNLATIYLPETFGESGNPVVVALDVANIEGLVASDITVIYDPAKLILNSVSSGSFISDWSFVHNVSAPGKLRISAASNGSILNGSGSIAVIEFEVLGNLGEVTFLVLEEVKLNDGTINPVKIDGSVTVTDGITISGSIGFWGNGERPLEGVNLNLEGAGLQSDLSDASGVFILTGLIEADYTLTPSHTSDVYDISAYDAALTLQHSVGQQTLTGHAAIAADVNRNGTISSMDAYHILQHAAALEDITVPGGGVAWVFDPPERSYSQLASNQINQNFSAILLGDVSGNWNSLTQQGGGFISMGTHGLVDYRGDRALSRLLMQSTDAKVYGADLVLEYNAGANLSSISAAGFSSAINTSTPGEIRAALASASGVNGSQSMLQLEFDGTTDPNLTLLSASINEGAVLASGSVLIEAFDSDSDGLLDLDETELLGTNPDSDDTDKDGSLDTDEIFAGTNPIDSNSSLRTTEVTTAENGNLVVSWQSVPGRYYQLERSVSLNGDWFPFGDSVEATATTTTIEVVDLLTDGRAFYRVRVIQ
jgi:hypothetical protein